MIEEFEPGQIKDAAIALAITAAGVFAYILLKNERRKRETESEADREARRKSRHWRPGEWLSDADFQPISRRELLAAAAFLAFGLLWEIFGSDDE